MMASWATHTATGPGLKVRATQCGTCIYRPSSGLNLTKLEAEAADPAVPGHFARWRACHTSDYQQADIVCAGFYRTHGDNCTPIQIATRLGGVTWIGDESR